MSFRRFAQVVAGLLAVAALFATTAAFGGGSKYKGTLSATPNVLKAGEKFTVSGCGYDTALGNVIIGFTGGGWGSALDANGCFRIADIPALSGDTLAQGTYPVEAFQYIHNKWTEIGQTSVTVVP
jgi:hypothetical protein